MISVVGQASAAATSVALPAHQPGDLIVMAARRANNTAPSMPTLTGTVARWISIDTGGASTLSLVTAFAYATASNHTSGTWTNASHVAVIVLRGSEHGLVLQRGSHAQGTGSAANIAYPALALDSTAGGSLGVRIATRATAAAGVGTAPPDWVNQATEPSGAAALLSIHTRAGLTANPTAATVAITGSAAFRAQTIEVMEAAEPAPVFEAMIDDFNRANARLSAGTPWSALWIERNNNSATGTTTLNVISNTVGSTSTGWNQANILPAHRTPTEYADLLIDCVAPPPGTGNDEFGLWAWIDNPNNSARRAFLWSSGQGSQFLSYFNGATRNTWLQLPGRIYANETMWLSKRGNVLNAYVKPAGGAPFLRVFRHTIAISGAQSYLPVDAVSGIEVSDSTQRWDNFRGGGAAELPPAGPVTKAWTGSAWVEGTPKGWTGSAWAPVRAWDGSEWLTA